KALNIFFQAPKNKDIANRQLHEMDWQIIEDMEIVLEICITYNWIGVNSLQVPHSAQQLMSHDTLPVLSHAVPTIETVIVQWEHLSTHLSQCVLYIKVGLEYAKKYYPHMDKTNAYAIMMFVDPTLHLTWMEEHWNSAEVFKVCNVILEKVNSYLF
ncbi:hypothetical protein V8B97DRAFT_1876341, partial [Scleroderma yunnanense]